MILRNILFSAFEFFANGFDNTEVILRMSQHLADLAEQLAHVQGSGFTIVNIFALKINYTMKKGNQVFS